MKKILFLLGSFFLASCSDHVAGTATDTENTFAGVVKTSTGSYARSALVQMISVPSDLSSELQSISTQTDSLGVFAFDTLISDTFNLEIHLLDDSGNLKEMAFYTGLDAYQTKNLEVELDKPAYITGVLEYDAASSEINVGSSFYVSVFGSVSGKHLMVGDSFSIPVPVGTQTISIAPTDKFIIERLHQNGYEDSQIFKTIDVDTKSGEKLPMGNVHWSLNEKKNPMWEKGSVFTGIVIDTIGKPLAQTTVRVISDIYGLEWAMGRSKPTPDLVVHTDSLGRFTLPFPEGPLYDSLRIEAETSDGRIGESRFVSVDELMANKGNAIQLDTLVVNKATAVNGSVRLVVNMEDSTQTDNCVMNGVIVGIVGTDNFVNVVTCESFSLTGLPVGNQKIVFYTSDPTVLRTLQERERPLESYIQFISITLDAGSSLKQQWITYTPPTL